MLLRSAVQEEGRYLQCRKQHIAPYRVSPKIRPGLMLIFFLQNVLWGSFSGGCLIKNHAGAYLPLRSCRGGEEVVVTVRDKFRLALCGQSCGSYG